MLRRPKPRPRRHTARRPDQCGCSARREVGPGILELVDEGSSCREDQVTSSTVRRLILCVAFLSVTTSAAAQQGKAVYEKSCATCHGDAGQGRLAPALVPFTRGSQELLRIVRAGAGTMMNGFSAAEVSDADVRAIEEYLRSVKPTAASNGSGSGAPTSGPVVFGNSAVPTAKPSNVDDKRRMVQWPFVGADQNNSRYSPLEDITAANVDRLAIAWQWR